ncbi:MAG: HAD-IA family hydrolase [Oscillospiraceae bacterium]|nr:HAD-IA family hydrolase [Oscillospiraceae bacterium]
MKTLFLDMYGVILKESKGNFLPYTYAHFPAQEHDRLTRLIRGEKLFTRASAGELDSDEFLAQLGYADPGFSMRDYLERYLTLDPEFLPFAREFSGKYSFVLLSNDVSAWSRHLMDFHGLRPYFADAIVSADVHLRKPDPAIFAAALARRGVLPGDCLFVDNSVANLNAAEAAGIHPILFSRDGEAYDGETITGFSQLAKLL